MASISITFDPATDREENILGVVRQAFDTYTEEVGFEGETPVSEIIPGGWTLPKMRRYIAALRPTGRAALKAMAEHAPVVTSEVVQEATGLTGMEYAGSMSTFGHAVRRVRGVNSVPFSRTGDTYFLDRGVASLALEVLESYEAEAV